MTRGLDMEKAEAAMKRAAEKALHGTREERSGRFHLTGKIVHVNSSMMTDVGYDDDRNELDITFVGGKTYRYFDVPRDVYNALLEAESQGQFFNERIRDRFEFNEVPARR